MVAKLVLAHFVSHDKQVRRRMERGRRRSLSRWGGIARQDMRRKVKRVKPTSRQLALAAGAGTEAQRVRAKATVAKKRRQTSQPGRPPISHAADQKQSIRFILFDYSSKTRSVIVGPVKFRAKGQNVPRALERGGRTVVVDAQGRLAVRQIARRPFVKPTGDTLLKKLPGLFKNSMS